ncbi:MAG: hypothetical protein E7429_00265 [Ruminococcaceae bacterium]|nr:hypothetical protein [Oscillospiraceae bacterium]
MALADVLRERISRKGNRAQVVCGELGLLTVEALPPAELTALLRGSGGARAVLYAACRELQEAGEALRKTGEVFQPDEILAFVSEEETQAAVGTILELSGMEQSLPERAAHAEGTPLPAGIADEAEVAPADPALLPGAFPDPLAATAAPGTSPLETTAAETPTRFPGPLAVLAAAPAAPGELPADPRQAAPEKGGLEAAHGLRQPAAPAPFGTPQPAAFKEAPTAPQRSAAAGDRSIRAAESPAAESALEDAVEVRLPLPEQDAVSADALAEQVARRILAGLRNAAAVR